MDVEKLLAGVVTFVAGALFNQLFQRWQAVQAERDRYRQALLTIKLKSYEAIIDAIINYRAALALALFKSGDPADAARLDLEVTKAVSRAHLVMPDDVIASINKHMSDVSSRKDEKGPWATGEVPTILRRDLQADVFSLHPRTMAERLHHAATSTFKAPVDKPPKERVDQRRNEDREQPRT